VKKVVFPLEMLPLASVLGSAVRCLAALALILPAVLYLQGAHWGQLWLIYIFFNFVLIGAGISWVVSAFGVYVRDITPFVQLVATLIMFCSAVFYSPDRIPALFTVLKCNPILIGLDLARNVFLWNYSPNYIQLSVFSLSSIFSFGLGYWVFASLREGFSDAL
jgi:lipopolysaccharide transport system permease protein